MLKRIVNYHKKEGIIYLPKNLREDSQFPITDTLISIEIKNERLIIREAGNE